MKLVSGTGNNGGDRLGIARLLSRHRYSIFVWKIIGLKTHGLAEDLAENQYGKIGIIDSDIIDFLSQAFDSFSNKHNNKKR